MRSASSIVRAAFCSTSRIVTPASRELRRASRTRGRRDAAPGRATARRAGAGAARASSARAIASCCCSPPESVPAGVRKRLAAPGSGRARARAPRRRARGPARRRPERQVLAPRSAWRRCAGPQARARPRAATISSVARPDERLPEVGDLAPGDRHEPEDRRERRRLAGPVRADEADDLALARPRGSGPRRAGARP